MATSLLNRARTLLTESHRSSVSSERHPLDGWPVARRPLRRDHHLQEREGKPHTTEGKPPPSREPELPEQCVIASQAKKLHMMAQNCRNFRWQFNAYKEIPGSSTIDCETVLSVRDLALGPILDLLGRDKIF